MNRREFSIQTLTAAAGAVALGAAGLPSSALAQSGPVEGTHYVKLSQAVPTSAPAGKVEVLEFFWYGCPHCNHFEPYLNAWAGKLPADVVFKRVPVVLRENPGAIHQRLFYALEALGLLPTLHAKVFHALHEEGLRLDNPEAIGDFMAKNGVDKAKFLQTMDSFGVQSKCRSARALADAYKLDGVPTVGIAGLYFTSIGLNGTPEKTLATVNALIDKVRKAR
jgi:thiol:disulfide interchange protein DsbA